MWLRVLKSGSLQLFFFFTFLFFSLFFELPKVGGKQGWRTTTAPLIGSFKVQVASGYEYAVDN